MADKTVTVEQIASPARRQADQRATLVGLGLNKLHRTVEVEGTPEVLGQVRKVQHLVKVEEVIFDRGGYLYHGRVKALADAAREAGLKF